MLKKIGIACDHAGYDLKSFLIKELKNSYDIIDLGTDNADQSVDYPDFAVKLWRKLIKGEVEFGVLICGSGVGISIAANRFFEIRAALCTNQKTAKLARKHNDANVLCLGARNIKKENALKCVKVFLSTSFEGGRHEKRVKKLSEDAGK